MGVMQTLPSLALSQEIRGGPCGCEDYCIVVKGETTELVHEYCSYHGMAGPVRPHKVDELRLEGNIVKWEWSENSYDVSSAGAKFERQLAFEDGTLAWAGPVRRTPKVKAKPVPPAVSQPTGVRSGPALQHEDIQVEDKHWRDMGGDNVAIHITHTPSGSALVWDGDSTAENQSLSRLKSSVVDGLLHIEFVYFMSENGDRHSSDKSLFVKLGSDGLELVN